MSLVAVSAAVLARRGAGFGQPPAGRAFARSLERAARRDAPGLIQNDSTKKHCSDDQKELHVTLPRVLRLVPARQDRIPLRPSIVPECGKTETGR